MKNKYKRVVLSVLIIVLVMAAGVFIGMHLYRSNQKTSGVVLDASAEAMESASPESGIAIPGYSIIHVDADSGEAKIDLINPDGNPCYFKYEISYADSGDLIYESDLIEPGKSINGFTLKDVPDAGEYDILIAINTYSLEDGTTAMNGAQISAVLSVEK